MATPSHGAREVAQPLPLRGLICHLGAAFLLGIAVTVLFIQEPGLGDDINYWRLALWHHIGEGKPWDEGFHSLRWPVWGVCWLLMHGVGLGLPSYYGEPAVYMGFGAVLCFIFGRWAFGRTVAGWCCAIAWLFQPMLDPALTRPMPDLSEGIWMGAAFLAWYGLMAARGRGAEWLLAALLGLCLAIAHANRLTGVFVIPILVVLTLVAFPRRLGQLVIAGAFTLGFVAIECWVYQALTGDFLHSLHANMSAKGRKGTESMPLWELPFRFIDSLFEGNLLKVPYMAAAAAGATWAWRSRNRLGLLVTGWFLLLFLEYSCGLQSLNPPRPLVRDGDRFLSSLGMPLSVLAGMGTIAFARWLPAAWPKASPWLEWAGRRPILCGAMAVVLLTVITSRDLWDPGFVVPLRRYLKEVAPGTPVLTHDTMRDIARLVGGRKASEIRWLEPALSIERSPELDAAAADAKEIWYNRKIIWTSTRKDLESEELAKQPPVPACLGQALPEWRVAEVISKDRTPDMVFMTRRQSVPAPEMIDGSHPALAQWLGGFAERFSWKRTGKEKSKWTGPDLVVPDAWRGRIARLELSLAGNTVEAVSGRLQFSGPDGQSEDFVIKPYLFPSAGIDFFAFRIPEWAEGCRVIIYLSKGADWIRSDGFRLALEPADTTAR